MSMNIHFAGVRDIQVVKTGAIERQEDYINVWQTPTEVTYNIANSDNPVRAYVNWVLTQSEDIQEPVYADDDIFGEHEPVGHTTYNPARDHAAAFLKEVRLLRRCGFAIEAQVM
jgi:hypothetical protein